MYQFNWIPANMVQPDFRQEMSNLYSHHYGLWGEAGPNPGKHVRLSSQRMNEWLTGDSYVYWATLLGELVGYAIAVRNNYGKSGSVAWVTQLVVHEEHRNRDIAKRLLFSIWKFTDHSAWGVLSANPYAIRALEKATRRRCMPTRIKVDVRRLLKFGENRIRYVNHDSETVVNDVASRINTDFPLDHSELPEMLKNVSSRSDPWALGPLEEGWEWFAFTFRDQQQLSLGREELAEMMAASDQITHEAFSRMALGSSSQSWAVHSKTEIEFVAELFNLLTGDHILDFGCGNGRHSIALAELGMIVTGVDYVGSFVEHAAIEAKKWQLDHQIDFRIGDCRFINLGKHFDFAICIYDVIGTYAEQLDNVRILKNLVEHLNPGAQVLISVMNLELTKQKAVNWFSLEDSADALLDLPASAIMETTGNIFDPKYYIIDRDTEIVYRKEQFKQGDLLPEEMIVRDRRYTLDNISQMCVSAGLEVVWARRVRAGYWNTDLPYDSDRAKEILLYCRLKGGDAQQALF